VSAVAAFAMYLKHVHDEHKHTQHDNCNGYIFRALNAFCYVNVEVTGEGKPQETPPPPGVIRPDTEPQAPIPTQRTGEALSKGIRAAGD
jgi:hypothetical protein